MQSSPLLPESASHGPLWKRLRTQPRISDQARASTRLAELAASPEAVCLKTLIDRPQVRTMLAGLADHSSYLWQLAVCDAARLARILDSDPRARLLAVFSELRAARDPDEAEVMRRLRQAKQELALLIALVDLGGVWPLDDILKALSKAADVLIGVAVDHLLRQAVKTGKLRLRDIDEPSKGCGLSILGLGKLGGLELNYSSDVDLIAVFDPDAVSIVRPDEAKPSMLGSSRISCGCFSNRRPRDMCSVSICGCVRTPDRRLSRSRWTPLTSITRASAELGTRGDDQGPPGGGRSRLGGSFPRWPRTIRLAALLRLCVDRRHPCDEASDP
jgi:Glutamine synthetase adenylyltransferase